MQSKDGADKFYSISKPSCSKTGSVKISHEACACVCVRSEGVVRSIAPLLAPRDASYLVSGVLFPVKKGPR
jgi:ribosomal protein L32